MPINHLVLLNDAGMQRVIDAFGGIRLYNARALINCNYPGGTRVSFPHGWLQLNGKKALIYARVRQCDDDFQRQGRQQLVVSALKGKVLSLSNIWQAPWIGANAIRAVTTDLWAIELGWLQHGLNQSPADRVVLGATPAVIGALTTWSVIR